jgi:hypothetical protein
VEIIAALTNLVVKILKKFILQFISFLGHLLFHIFGAENLIKKDENL